MNLHRRGELVTDPKTAVTEIQTGHLLMHNTCVLSVLQLRTWPVGKLTVADRGLREGILMELMAADGCAVAGLPPTSAAGPESLQ